MPFADADPPASIVPLRLISLLGLFVMVGVAWLMSSNRKRVSVRIVIGGLVLQFVFAAIVLKTPWGEQFFEGVSSVFVSLVDCVDGPCEFVFGKEYAEHYFAFKVLSIIIFFSALSAVLFHLGVVQVVVRGLGWVMHRTLGTSGAESLTAAANVFVGQTEAPLLIRPYLGGMTRSELMSVMVGGFATIAGSVMAAYVSFGIEAGHLLTASIISAPAALLIAKVMQPEVDTPQTTGLSDVTMKPETTNLIDALTTGAAEGVKLAINVAAMIIAFLAIVALVNLGLDRLGDVFGYNWSLEAVFGVVFYPFAWIMGVQPDEAQLVGQLLGFKTVANEFIAYQQLGTASEYQGLSYRSKTIATYALCGFANFGSVGIQIGALSLMAPGPQNGPHQNQHPSHDRRHPRRVYDRLHCGRVHLIAGSCYNTVTNLPPFCRGEIMRRSVLTIALLSVAIGLMSGPACGQKNGRNSYLGKTPPELVSDQTHWLVHSKKLSLAKLKGELVWLQFNY